MILVTSTGLTNIAALVHQGDQWALILPAEASNEEALRTAIAALRARVSAGPAAELDAVLSSLPNAS